MGNEVSSEKKDLSTVLPGDVWPLIALKLTNIITVHEVKHLEYDLCSISRLMRTCKTFYKKINSETFWKTLCSSFNDFSRLEEMFKTLDVHIPIKWKELYKIRTTSIYKEELIKVGDQENPESIRLIHLRGDGECFLSIGWSNGYSEEDISSNIKTHFGDSYNYLNDGRLFTMKPLRSVLFLEKDPKDIFTKRIFNAFMDTIFETERFKTKKTDKEIQEELTKQAIVDIAFYSPTIMILSKYGCVFEWLFVPKHMDNVFGNFTKPRMLNVNTKINYIKCTAAASYAIGEPINSEDLCSVYVWSIVNDPINPNSQIRTEPVLLEALCKFSIKNIIQIDDTYTEFYYTTPQNEDPNVEKIDKLVIDNVQIFAFIVDKNFM